MSQANNTTDLDTSEPFILTSGMADNYKALQRFFRQEKAQRGPNKGGGFSKSPKRRRRKAKLLAAQGYRCVDCHAQFEADERGKYGQATADHVIPHRFGATIDHNCEFVCDPCNQRREFNRIFHIRRYFGSIDEPT